MTEAEDAGNAGLVICDVGALTRPDAGTVDALARLQLAARRCGCRIRLRNVGPELEDLLALAGLAEAVPVESRVQRGREPEQGEQPGGVEELGEPADPTV